MAAQDTRAPRSLLIRCAQPLPDRDGPNIVIRPYERDQDRWIRAWWEWRRARWIYCQRYPWQCRQGFDYWYSGQDPVYRDFWRRHHDDRQWRSGRDWRDGYYNDDREDRPYRDNDRNRYDPGRRWDRDRDRDQDHR